MSGAAGRVLQVAEGRGPQHPQIRPLAVDRHLAVVDRVQPRPVLVRVGGVDHDLVDIFAPVIDQQIVDHPAVGVQQIAVEALAGGIPAHVIGAHQVEELGRVRAAGFEDAHVCHVEEPGGLADRVVLVEHAGVPDGHVPAGKRDDLAGVRPVPLVKGCALERGARRLFPLELGPVRIGAFGVERAVADEIGFAQLEAPIVAAVVDLARRRAPVLAGIARVA